MTASDDERGRPVSRRHMWLTIALAVARDGLPAPEIRYSKADYTGTPYIYVVLEGHGDARCWARWLGHTDDLKCYERPDLGLKYADVDILYDGWRVTVHGIETLEPTTTHLLAVEVAASAVLTDAS